MQADDTILKLIQKISSPILQIQCRAISSLFTKLSVGVFHEEQLIRLPMLPGLLMTWINEVEGKRSDTLLKALLLLQHYVKTSQGVELLLQYECIEFLDELRTFLRTHETAVEDHVRVAQAIIKAMLPFSPSNQQHSINNNCQKYTPPPPPSPTVQPIPKSKFPPQQKYSIDPFIYQIHLPIDAIPKQLDQRLYRALIQLKHTRHPLPLLQQILRMCTPLFSFRYYPDLIRQVSSKLPLHPHLCTQILQILLQGAYPTSHSFLHNSQLTLQHCKDIEVELNASMFQSVYSYQMYHTLVQQSLKPSACPKLHEWLLCIPFKYSYKPYLRLLSSRTTKYTPKIRNIIAYYCHLYPQCKQYFIDIVTEDIPQLVQHKTNCKVLSSYKRIEKYFNIWQQPEPQFNTLLNDLEQGIAGVHHNIHSSIRLYLQVLLYCVVKMKTSPYLRVFLLLLNNTSKDIRYSLFEQLFTLASDTTTISYKKVFVRNEVVNVFVQEELNALLESSLSHAQTTKLFLQTVKRLGTKLGKYCGVLFTLTHHSDQGVSSLAHLLLTKISKQERIKTALMPLFSTQEEVRTTTMKQLFGVAVDPITNTHHKPIKKPLIVSPQSIIGLSALFFNQQLEDAVRVTAANQLKQTISRAEVSQVLNNSLLALYQQLVDRLLHEEYTPMLMQLLQQLLKATNYSPQLKIIPLQTLITLIGKSITKDPSTHISPLIKLTYLHCFQSPFSLNREIHFSFLHYQHLAIVPLPTTTPLQQAPPTTTPQQQPYVFTYQQSFKGECQRIYHNLIHYNINKQHQTLQKQIGVVLHASTSQDHISLLCYILKRTTCSNLGTLHSNMILNSLLTGNNPHLLPLLNIIPTCSTTKQLKSCLTTFDDVLQINAPTPILLQHFPLLVKKALPDPFSQLNLMKLLLRCEMGQTEEYIQVLLTNVLTKHYAHGLVRRTALVALHTYVRNNVVSPSNALTFVYGVMQEKIEVSEFCLVGCIMRQSLANVSVGEYEGRCIKYVLYAVVPLLNKLVPTEDNVFIIATVVEIINSLYYVQQQEQSLLQKIISNVDVTDSVISILGAYVSCKEKSKNTYYIIGVCIQHLHLSNKTQYYIASTNLLSIIVELCLGFKKINLQFQDTKILYSVVKEVSILIHVMSREEDLFIRKMSQLTTNIYQLIFSLFSFAGPQYCRMFGWLAVIWWKGRSFLDTIQHTATDDRNKSVYTPGSKLAQLSLSYQILQIRALVSVCSSAKVVLTNSDCLLNLLKHCTSVIEDSVRKKQPPNQQIKDSLSLLTALFHQVQFDSVLPLNKQSVQRIIYYLDRHYTYFFTECNTLYMHTVTNLSYSHIFGPCFASYQSENHSRILDSTLSALSTATPPKQSFALLSILSHHQSVRSVILKNKFIEQLSKRINTNIALMYEGVQVLSTLARYKDTAARIIENKQIVEAVVNCLAMQRSGVVEEIVAVTLRNLACFKGSKPILMANREIHKVVLGVLTLKTTYAQHLVAFIYNLVYKNAQGCKLYRKKEVVDIIREQEDSQVLKALLEALNTQEEIK